MSRAFAWNVHGDLQREGEGIDYGEREREMGL